MRLQPGSRLPMVRGDRIQLQQVIINLVINAIQAMATVTDRERVLFLRTQRHDPDHVLVAVEDVGVGILDPIRLGPKIWDVRRHRIERGAERQRRAEQAQRHR